VKAGWLRPRAIPTREMPYGDVIPGIVSNTFVIARNQKRWRDTGIGWNDLSSIEGAVIRTETLSRRAPASVESIAPELREIAGPQDIGHCGQDLAGLA
jgi:hypothetical protein